MVVRVVVEPMVSAEVTPGMLRRRVESRVVEQRMILRVEVARSRSSEAMNGAPGWLDIEEPGATGLCGSMEMRVRAPMDLTSAGVPSQTTRPLLMTTMRWARGVGFFEVVSGEEDGLAAGGEGSGFQTT